MTVTEEWDNAMRDLTHTVLKLKGERDELLAALQAIVAADTFCACSSYSTESRVRYAKAMEAALNAIAKATQTEREERITA